MRTGFPMPAIRYTGWETFKYPPGGIGSRNVRPRPVGQYPFFSGGSSATGSGRLDKSGLFSLEAASDSSKIIRVIVTPPLPPTIQMAGETWYVRGEFHLTLFGPAHREALVDYLVTRKGLSKNEARELVKVAEKNASRGLTIRVLPTTDFRKVETTDKSGEKRRTIIVMCDLEGAGEFEARLAQELEIPGGDSEAFPRRAYHVTLYTGENRKPIGIGSREVLESLSTVVPPDQLSSPWKDGLSFVALAPEAASSTVEPPPDEREVRQLTVELARLLVSGQTAEGKSTGNLIKAVKGRVYEDWIRGVVGELRELAVSLRRQPHLGEAFRAKLEEFRAMFVKKEGDQESLERFLNLFGPDSVPIFLEDSIPGAVGKIFNNVPMPDLVIARTAATSDGSYQVTLIPCDFKLHPWSESTDAPTVRVQQIDPSQSRLGQLLSDKQSTQARVLLDHLVGIGALPPGAIVHLKSEKGRVIAVEAPVPTPEKNPYLSLDGIPFSERDLALIDSRFLVGVMRERFIDSFRSYLELLNRNPSEADAVFSGNPVPLANYVQEEPRDYTTKKLLRGPISRVLEIALIQLSMGQDRFVTDLPDLKGLVGVLAEVKKSLDSLPGEERLQVTRDHESLRRFLLERFIASRPSGKVKDPLSLGNEIVALVGRGPQVAVVNAVLFPYAQFLRGQIGNGALTPEAGRAGLIAMAARITQQMKLRYEKAPTAVGGEGSNITVASRIMTPAAEKSTLGSREVRRAFVRERIPSELVTLIEETIQKGRGVDLSLHQGRDSEVKGKWDSLGPTPFPRPGGTDVSSGVAAKKSEKRFYWREDEHGNLFITVTNLFGQDNLRKTSRFFAELGVLHNVVFDYRIDYAGEVKAALEQAKMQGMSLDVVAIGPQGSVLGVNMDQRTLAFEAGNALRGFLDGKADLPGVIRDSLKQLTPEALKKRVKSLVNEEVRRGTPSANELLAQVDAMTPEVLADHLYQMVFGSFDFGKILEFGGVETFGRSLSAMDSDLLQYAGYFLGLLKYCGLDAPLGLRRQIDQAQKKFEKKKLTKSGDEEIFSIATNRFPDQGGKSRALVTINIAYGDLSASIAQALREMGVKRIIFNGTAGYDVSNPTERAKKERLQLKAGDIIVPTTLRDNKGKIIPGINMTSLENIIRVLESQRREYRIVSVLGEGSVLKDSPDPHAATLILSHHGNVDSLLDETSAYMASLSAKGVRSIEIEAAEAGRMVVGTGIEYMPLVYISDFPGEEGATFAEAGVEAVSQDGARRAKDIFTDLVMDQVFRANGVKAVEAALMTEFHELAETVLPYFLDREKTMSAGDRQRWGETLGDLIGQIRKAEVPGWNELRLLLEYLKRHSKSEAVRDLIDGNERYYLFQFPARIRGNEAWQDVLRTAVGKILIQGSPGDGILATRFLTSLQDEKTLDFLLENKDHRKLAVRREITKAIGILGTLSGYPERVVRVLLENLSDRDSLIRWNAAFHLRGFSGTEVMTALKGLIQKGGRENWILIAGMMSGEKFRILQDDLRKGLQSEDEHIRNLATSLWERYGNARAPSSAVTESAREPIRRTEDQDVPLTALEKKVRDRVVAMLLGTGIGDALGLPVEFLPHEVIQQQFGEVAGYVTNEGRRRQVCRRGTTSDDTQMTIALVESLIGTGGFDPEDLSRRFGALAQAFDSGQMADSGYSASMMEIMRLLSIGLNWRLTGSPDKKGDGAAMRAAPIGALHVQDPDAVRADAEVQARITHASPEAIASSQAISYMIARVLMLKGEIDTNVLLEDLSCFIEPASLEFAEKIRSLGNLLTTDTAKAIKTIGADSKQDGSQAIVAIPAAIYLFLKSPHDFRQAVLAAVNLCGDSDTVASMVGALAGAYNGTGSIPGDWIEGLEQSGRLIGLGEKLFRIVRRRQSD